MPAGNRANDGELRAVRLTQKCMTSIGCFAFVTLAIGICAPLTHAQDDYPTKPIRLLVPSAGGSTDVLARIVSARLSEGLKKQVVVDSRPSAAGVIATQIAATSRPDGYTLILTYTQHTVNAVLSPKLPYHPVNDFTPITQLTAAGLVLVTNTATPVKTVEEFVRWTRSHNGGLNYGTGGIGSAGHLAAELYNLMAGIKAENVAYKGPAPALLALASGEIHYMFAGLQSSRALVDAGKLRALAVTTPKRLSALGDLPPMSEILPGFEIVGWYGVLGPAKLPKSIVAKLSNELIKAIQQPDTRERIVADGSEPVGSSPEDFQRFMQAEFVKWAKVVKQSGMTGSNGT